MKPLKYISMLWYVKISIYESSSYNLITQVTHQNCLNAFIVSNARRSEPINITSENMNKILGPEHNEYVASLNKEKKGVIKSIWTENNLLFLFHVSPHFGVVGNDYLKKTLKNAIRFVWSKMAMNEDAITLGAVIQTIRQISTQLRDILMTQGLNQKLALKWQKRFEFCRIVICSQAEMQI